MKIKSLSLAVAAVLSAGFAHSSFAATATAVTGTALATLQASVPSLLTANTLPAGTSAGASVVVINLAGSSAQDKAIQNILAGDILTAGTLKIFKDDYSGTSSTSNWGGRWTTYIGTTGVNNQAGTALPAALQNKTLIVNKRSIGGSGYGILPLSQGIPVNFSNLPAALAGSTVYQDTTQTIPTYGVNVVEQSGAVGGGTVAGTNTYQAIPDGGVADTNPDLYGGSNTVYDFANSPVVTSPAVSSTDIGKLKITTAAAFTFGVPVSTDLFRALQVAQGLIPAASLPATANYGTTLGDDSLTPNLTSAQVAALISGNVQTWDQVTFNGQTVIQAAAAAGIPVPTDHLVHYLERLQGSGTAAQQYARFLGYNPNSVNAAGPATDQTASGGPAVNALAEGADEEAAFDDLALGTSVATDALTGTSINAGVKAWAIGQLSADKNANNSLTTAYGHNYRFVKIDGATPTLKNVFSGKYKDWAQSSWVLSSSNVSKASAATLAAITYFQNQGTLAAVLAKANVKQAFGDQTGNNTGYLGLPDHNTATSALSLTAPVIPYFYPNGDNSVNPVPYANNINLIFQ